MFKTKELIDVVPPDDPLMVRIARNVYGFFTEQGQDVNPDTQQDVNPDTQQEDLRPLIDVLPPPTFREQITAFLSSMMRN